MLECLILGDSIATGVAMHRKECVSYAQVGINSKQYNRLYETKKLNADTVIISLGTNDNKYVDTYAELLRLRNSITAKKVIWIMPVAVNPMSGTSIGIVRLSVESVAGAYNDTVITIPKPMADRYHPTNDGYKKLANQTRR
jgi:lysophospholipase L1-like esterase